VRDELLVGDLFCGLGGFTEGAREALEALGLRMRIVVVNHWPVAIATHQANHPDAKHLCADAYKLSPREAVPGGRLDLLMASPTCTFFSRSRGGKPISWDQRWGRMTPTQVVRWITELDVGVLLVENVPEFREWGPVHPGPKLEADGKTVRVPAPPVRNERCLDGGCKPGKPCRRKRGAYFRPWLRKIERLGYQFEHRVLNAADYGDATTRQRFFLIARKDGVPITWPEPTHSKTGRGEKRWRAAREIIDWSIPGRSIFDRKRPLSPKTLARIYAGAVKFGWPEPFLVVLRQHMDALGVDTPLPTIVASGTHIALVQPGPVPAQGELFPGAAEPLLVRSAMHKSNALCVRGADEPIATVTTDGGIALAQPMILPQRSHQRPRGVDDEPVPVITTTSRGIGLAQPFVFANRTNNVPKSPERDPLPGITTTTGGGLALVLPQGGGGAARPVEHPCVTGARRGELAFIAAAFGEREGQAPRVHSVDAPAPTVCAKGRVQLVQGEEEPRVDVLFRMLQPHELSAAMGFTRYRTIAGTKEEVTRQIGNAVPVRTARALVTAILTASRARKARTA